MVSLAWEALPPEVTSGFAEAGAGPGTWFQAAASLIGPINHLHDSIDRLNATEASNRANSSGDTTEAIAGNIAQTRGVLQERLASTKQQKEAATAVGHAAMGLRSGITPLAEVTATKTKLEEARLRAASGDPEAAVELSALETAYEGMRVRNGAAYRAYDTAVNPALEQLRAAVEGKSSSAVSPMSGAVQGVQSVAQTVLSHGGSVGNPGSITGRSGGRPSGASAQGQGGKLSYEVNEVSPDDIYNDYLKQYVGGTDTGSGLGSVRGGSSATPASDYQPSYASDKLHTNLSGYERAGSTSLSSYTPMSMSSYAGGGMGTSASYAHGFPGGAVALGRMAGGEGPARSFRGAGMGASAARSTGGLGLPAAGGSANAGQVFGGVQPASASGLAGSTGAQGASAGTGRPVMGGMMPGAAAHGKGAKRKGNGQAAKSHGESIFADTPAVAARKDA